MIKGGTAHNITALDCDFGLSFRIVPGETAEQWREAFLAKVAEVEAGMKAIAPSAYIDARDHFDVPALRPEENGSAERLVRQITGDNGTHMVSYGTEAGQFQREDYSAIICGPGDIAQAHQPNEFLSVDQFEKGAKFIERVVETLTD